MSGPSKDVKKLAAALSDAGYSVCPMPGTSHVKVRDALGNVRLVYSVHTSRRYLHKLRSNVKNLLDECAGK